MPAGAAADASPEAAFRIKLLEIAEAAEMDNSVFDFYLAAPPKKSRSGISLYKLGTSP